MSNAFTVVPEFHSFEICFGRVAEPHETHTWSILESIQRSILIPS
jgi:hypothetical protein